MDKTYKYYAVTGESHGLIIEAQQPSTALRIFAKFTNNEDIWHIRRTYLHPCI